MPLVAIVGRPNVGKSTIFNRLTESRAAITHDESGVTRDRVYGNAIWNGVDFDVVDTGGYVEASSDRFERAVKEQVEIAVDEADLVLFVVDVRAGVTDLDDHVAALLRSSSKPVVVMANKADNEKLRWDASEFYSFGLGEVFPVSATNGTGTGELLDDITRQLPTEGASVEKSSGPRIAVIGRPNVGKSSLVNALLGVDRTIVTEVSGTTRDSIDTVLKYHGREITLVDTAGLRRKAKVRENIEFYSVLRTERAIRECDVAILLIDATDGLEAQDIRVLKEAERLRKGLLIGMNKWDLVDKETNTARDAERAIHDRLQTLDYVPVVFISALTKQRTHKLVDRALEIVERSKRISTSKLNDTMLAAVERSYPPTHRNRFVRIKYVSQVSVAPPVFAFFCNYPDGIRESYRRYLENQIRDAFGFEGVPLSIMFRKK